MPKISEVSPINWKVKCFQVCKKRGEESRNPLIFDWRVRFTVENLRCTQFGRHTHTKIYTNPFSSKSYDVVNRSVYMCTGYSRRGRSRTSGSAQKERKKSGWAKRYQSHGTETPTAFVKRERHVQLSIYKAKLFIHYRCFATNQKICICHRAMRWSFIIIWVFSFILLFNSIFHVSLIY